MTAVRKKLEASIKRAKANYSLKIQGHFSTNDPWTMWKRKAVIAYDKRYVECPRDPSLTDACFEVSNTSPRTRLALPKGELPSSVSAEDVREDLLRGNPHKAAGLDNIPGQVLRDCAHMLMGNLTDIFNTSISQAVVPICQDHLQ